MKYKSYTQSLYYLTKGAVPPATPHRERRPSNPAKGNRLRLHGERERRTDSASEALSCRGHVEHPSPSFAGAEGQELPRKGSRVSSLAIVAKEGFRGITSICMYCREKWNPPIPKSSRSFMRRYSVKLPTGMICPPVHLCKQRRSQPHEGGRPM